MQWYRNKKDLLALLIDTYTQALMLMTCASYGNDELYILVVTFKMMYLPHSLHEYTTSNTSLNFHVYLRYLSLHLMTNSPTLIDGSMTPNTWRLTRACPRRLYTSLSLSPQINFQRSNICQCRKGLSMLIGIEGFEREAHSPFLEVLAQSRTTSGYDKQYSLLFVNEVVW